MKIVTNRRRAPYRAATAMERIPQAIKSDFE
jgi:hypothetical protein